MASIFCHRTLLLVVVFTFFLLKREPGAIHTSEVPGCSRVWDKKTIQAQGLWPVMCFAVLASTWWPGNDHVAHANWKRYTVAFAVQWEALREWGRRVTAVTANSRSYVTEASPHPTPGGLARKMAIVIGTVVMTRQPHLLERPRKTSVQGLPGLQGPKSVQTTEEDSKSKVKTGLGL